jgi:hypothetical protein
MDFYSCIQGFVNAFILVEPDAESYTVKTLRGVSSPVMGRGIVVLCFINTFIAGTPNAEPNTTQTLSADHSHRIGTVTT